MRNFASPDAIYRAISRSKTIPTIGFLNILCTKSGVSLPALPGLHALATVFDGVVAALQDWEVITNYRLQSAKIVGEAQQELRPTVERI